MHLSAADCFIDSHFQEHFFLTKHIHKKLTIIQITVTVYNSKQRKTKKFNRAFDEFDQFWPIWNLQYKYTTKKLFINTYYYWNNKHGNVKENVFCASSRIH